VKSGGASWSVFYASNGTIAASGTMPTGTYYDMALSGNGRDLDIAMKAPASVTRFHTAIVLKTENQPDNCKLSATGSCIPTNSDASTQTTPPTSTTGSGGGSGCFDHYSGPISVGSTYIPFPTWSNCASMVVQTTGTILFLALAVLFIQSRINKGRPEGEGVSLNGTLVMVFCFSLGYLISIYIWQAPFLMVLPVTAVAMAIVGFRARQAVA
jgi:hypothetical protein